MTEFIGLLNIKYFNVSVIMQYGVGFLWLLIYAGIIYTVFLESAHFVIFQKTCISFKADKKKYEFA